MTHVRLLLLLLLLLHSTRATLKGNTGALAAGLLTPLQNEGMFTAPAHAHHRHRVHASIGRCTTIPSVHTFRSGRPCGH